MAPTLLAQPPGPCCTSGVKHTGTPGGKIEVVAGVETYIAMPNVNSHSARASVILFYADVWSPLFINNMLIMDYFAENGESSGSSLLESRSFTETFVLALRIRRLHNRRPRLLRT